MPTSSPAPPQCIVYISVFNTIITLRISATIGWVKWSDDKSRRIHDDMDKSENSGCWNSSQWSLGQGESPDKVVGRIIDWCDESRQEKCREKACPELKSLMKTKEIQKKIKSLLSVQQFSLTQQWPSADRRLLLLHDRMFRAVITVSMVVFVDFAPISPTQILTKIIHTLFFASFRARLSFPLRINSMTRFSYGARLTWPIPSACFQSANNHFL